MRRVSPRCARAAATTRRPTNRLRRPDRPLNRRNAPSALEADARLPPASVEEPVSPLADGDLLGDARGADRLHGVLGICVAAAARVVAVSALGGGDDGIAAAPGLRRR